MIQIATAPEEKRAAYQLRYDIYVDELGRDFLATDHIARTISDSRDTNSTIMISKDNDHQLNGTLRVHISKWTPHLENRFGIKHAENEFKYAIVDNFVLKPELRNSRLALRFVIGVFEYGVERKVDLCLIEAAPDLLPMYEKMGFVPYRTVDKYDHLRYQLAIKPFDLEHLKSCRSIFYKIMMNRQRSLESTYINIVNRRKVS